MEFIDVGGRRLSGPRPRITRRVAVVVDPAEYPLVMTALERGGFTEDERFLLARKAFARTAAYDAAISNHLHSLDGTLPQVYTVQARNGRILRVR